MCILNFCLIPLYIYTLACLAVTTIDNNYTFLSALTRSRSAPFSPAKPACVDKIYTSSFDAFLPNALHVRLINYIFIVNTFGG